LPTNLKSATSQPRKYLETSTVETNKSGYKKSATGPFLLAPQIKKTGNAGKIIDLGLFSYPSRVFDRFGVRYFKG
jgi:hypothetical protein